MFIQKKQFTVVIVTVHQPFIIVPIVVQTMLYAYPNTTVNKYGIVYNYVYPVCLCCVMLYASQFDIVSKTEYQSFPQVFHVSGFYHRALVRRHLQKY